MAGEGAMPNMRRHGPIDVARVDHDETFCAAEEMLQVQQEDLVFDEVIENVQREREIGSDRNSPSESWKPFGAYAKKAFVGSEAKRRLQRAAALGETSSPMYSG